MTMQVVNLVQGSPEWHAHRAQHNNASDAPIMMGCSPNEHRRELVARLATGVPKEFSRYVQERILDKGHDFERLCRPRAEAILGEDLAPLVGVNGEDSSSYDGLTFMHDIGWEHKRLNATLREVMTDSCTGADLPLCYQFQMEHQCMVNPALEKVLFHASEWTDDDQFIEECHCWYFPNLELRAQLKAGWVQLAKDVASYDPANERQAPAVAMPVESLPAVVVQVNGALTVGGNLEDFGTALRTFIDRIPKKPSTDQEFADAEAATKALKKAEDALTTAEDGALAQISDVEVMRRTVADLKNLARTARLATEKLVAAEKEARRAAIVTGAQAQLDQHIIALNQRLGTNWLQRVVGGFGEVIKGKKSLANMDDAVAVALTNAKHEANQLADRLEANRKHLVQEDGDWIALFADFATVGTKAAEDFQALAALRIGNHKQQEAARLEAQREQIRKEEAAKLEREAAAAERKRIEEQAQQEKEAIAQAQQAGTLAAPVADDLAGLVQDKAVEGMAGIDANQAISTAKASAAAADTSQAMTLGQVNTLLEAAGLGKISAATLEHHGIPFTRERGAVQVTESNTKRLALLLSLGFRKLADELQAVTA